MVEVELAGGWRSAKLAALFSFLPCHCKGGQGLLAYSCTSHSLLTASAATTQQ